MPSISLKFQKPKEKPQKFGLLISRMDQEYSYYINIFQSIAKGRVGTADATFTMVDDDMMAMA